MTMERLPLDQEIGSAIRYNRSFAMLDSIAEHCVQFFARTPGAIVPFR